MTKPTQPITYIVHLRPADKAGESETIRDLRTYLKRLGRNMRMRCVKIERKKPDDETD